jgi:hypothetical protein
MLHLLAVEITAVLFCSIKGVNIVVQFSVMHYLRFHLHH